jgi:transcriptional regulator with XRE-family HTH domain
MNIGDRLRKIRTENKLTVKQLSVSCGVPEKTIYRIETGEVKDPKLSSLEPVIKALNCSADELLFDIEEFTKLGQLRQAFANASELPEHELDTLITMINKFTLATNIEGNVSKSMKN